VADSPEKQGDFALGPFQNDSSLQFHRKFQNSPTQSRRRPVRANGRPREATVPSLFVAEGKDRAGRRSMTKVGTPTCVTPEPKLAQVRRRSACAARMPAVTVRLRHRVVQGSDCQRTTARQNRRGPSRFCETSSKMGLSPSPNAVLTPLLDSCISSLAGQPSVRIGHSAGRLRERAGCSQRPLVCGAALGVRDREPAKKLGHLLVLPLPRPDHEVPMVAHQL